MGTIRFLIVVIILISWLPLVAWALSGHSGLILALQIELFFLSPFILMFLIGWIVIGGKFNEYINS